MATTFRTFIVDQGVEHDITIDADGQIIGDPPQFVGTEKVITAFDCPCGQANWEIDRRGYCGEDVFLCCGECGTEYTVEERKVIEAQPALQRVSSQFAQVMNLCHAATHHKKHGCDSDCNVSLTILRETAMFMASRAPVDEIRQLAVMISETDWL